MENFNNHSVATVIMSANIWQYQNVVSMDYAFGHRLVKWIIHSPK